MNVYDFDNTIFDGDSSVKFIKYSFLKHPFKVIFCTLKSSKYLFCKEDRLGKIKSEIFSFVKDINNLDLYVNIFVKKNMKHIKKFYLEKRKDNDLVISASFDFLIKAFCQELKIDYIATLYDTSKGCIIGKNCKGEEKIRRFKSIYKDAQINESYSDSLSDKPLLEYAKVSYLVKKNELIEYKK